VSPSDVPLRRRLLELPTEGRAPDAEAVRHRWSLFLELLRWAESGSCRHDAILRYFGDEEETLAGCGRCDVCRELADVGADASAEETAVVVRKALSAVARIHGRFGLGAAVALLRGDTDERLSRARLDQTRTFGALADRSEEWLWRLLRRCITPGWIDFEGGDRPVALLTADGAAVMRGERAAKLLLPSEARRAPGAAARPARVAVDDGALDERERALFEALRHYRLERSRRDGVPPYAVATDRALRDIARLRPADLDALEQAHGIGPAKAKRYGAELLAVVRSAPA
jgi:ATP-dependent DNA helicase RecQ